MISKFILQSSEATKESRLGSIIVAYNPFKRIPQLQKIDEVQQQVQVLSDPKRIQGLLYHPSIRRLQKQPEVRTAVDELTADPEVAEILRSGQMDRSMVLTLMSHPAVLKLIDQPGFLEQASKVIQGVGLNK